MVKRGRRGELEWRGAERREGEEDRRRGAEYKQRRRD